MTLFIDTSALVKLHIDEAGSDDAWRAVAGASALWVSAVACPEARSAFARRRRGRHLSLEDHDRVVRDLDMDWRRLNQVVVDGGVALAAGGLAARHALRGFDAVQLACALRVAVSAGVEVGFATYDDALRAAAGSEGLALA